MDVNHTNLSHYHGNISGLPKEVRMTVPLVTFTTSTVGNLIAIFVIWRNQRRLDKQSVFYTLVMALALLDLISTIATSPVTFIAYTVGHSVTELGGRALCNYSGINMVFFGIASMAVVFTMAVERLIAVRFAFFYHTKVDAKKTKVVVGLVLLFFLIFSALPLVGFGAIKEQPPGTWCFLDWKALEVQNQVFNLTVVAMGIIMMGGTIFCNLFVVASVVLKRRKMRIMNSALQMMSKQRLRKIALDEIQMMILLAVMTCVFVLCYVPLLLRITISQITAMYSIEDHSISWNLFAVRMASINPVLDPWVYILCRRSTIVSFFKLIKMIVTCQCSKDQLIDLFSSGREFKRRASNKSLLEESNRKQKPLPLPQSKDEQLELKFASKWRSGIGKGTEKSRLN